MKLSDKAQAALDKVVEKFQAGDLSPIVQVARIQRQGDPTPFETWSFNNKVMAFIQTGGDTDVRGFNQWKQAGRYVKKGEQAAYILAPIVKTYTDEETGEEKSRLIGFKSVPVFGISQTEGEEIPQPDYTPAELPPLADVAERLGVKVTYLPLAPDRLGQCKVDGSEIELGTEDASVFFHELAHAVHGRLNGGKLKGGQHKDQETVAEFTATVLMELYGLGDRTGNCWQYIQHYDKDPLKAVYKALGTVGQVLEVVLN